ncbi:MAG: deoxyhypusine synthase family protein [Acidobacteria bacterium]|nr:deoxyhypusine synthase family protein [Acidobacteriota bacterium]
MLEKMAQTSFQGRNLGQAYEIWKQMLSGQTTIFMGLAGAMTAGGMRRLVAYLLQNRLIDCLVSTGANLFHDIYESWGRCHWMGTPSVDDTILQDLMIDRIYDTYADESEFRKIDEWIGEFALRLEDRPYSTREFLYLLGGEVAKNSKEDGIITSAYKARVPVYCPAIGDSSIGIGIATHRYLKKEKGNRLLFDIIQDVIETAELAGKSPTTGVVFCGGGTPKNFINQTEVTASMVNSRIAGHQHAIQVITDSPQWGGLSGCTFEEAQSWGKIAKDAQRVTVHCDATIGFPTLVTALAHGAKELIARRKKPRFELGQRELKFSWDAG